MVIGAICDAIGARSASSIDVHAADGTDSHHRSVHFLSEHIDAASSSRTQAVLRAERLQS
jgi:hypothetical protein